VFVAKSVLYLVIVELLCKMLPKVKRIVIVVIVGAAVTLASVLTVELPKFIEALVTILSIGGIAAVFVIPLMLLLITKVKKNAQKNR
jgi:Na+/proline symporter